MNIRNKEVRNRVIFQRIHFYSANCHFRRMGRRIVFIPHEMKINLNGPRKSENFYINADGNFIGRDSEDKNNGEAVSEKCSALPHEIIHFTQHVVFSDHSKKEHTYRIEDIIKKSKNTSLQTFARYCDDTAPSNRLPHKIYDVTGDMLCMYEIIWDADEDTFYYDPINEAVANVEYKIFKGKKQKLVRTGHGIIKNAESLSKLNKDLNNTAFISMKH